MMNVLPWVEFSKANGVRGTMAIRISTSADDEGGIALRDLYEWLRQDPDVRRHTALSLTAAQRSPSAMGALDVVDVVLGQGIAALNLALAYAAWRRARPTAPAVTITVDGVSITVQDGSDETVRRIVRELTASSPSASSSPAAPDRVPDGPQRGDGSADTV